MIVLTVNPGDPTPPFEQIRRQFAHRIDAGDLAPGQRLPTVRQLAADLGVAPGTVSRAFKELESAEYVETRRAAGTRVKERPRTIPAASLAHHAQTYVNHAIREGATPDQIIHALHTALAHEKVQAPR